MAGNRFLLVARDLAVGEAGEIVIALVVFLDVLEAEQKELPLGIASDGSAMHAFLVAAVPLTGRGSLFGFRLAFAAGADAVEVFGIESHDGANYGAPKS